MAVATTYPLDGDLNMSFGRTGTVITNIGEGTMGKLGVNIMATVAPVVGAVVFLPSIGLLGAQVLTGGIGKAAFGWAAVIAFIALATFAAEVAFAIGAVMLRPWAWAVGVAGQVLLLLTILLWTIHIGPFSIGFNYQSILIVIAGAMLIYLCTPGVRRAFGQGRS